MDHPPRTRRPVRPRHSALAVLAVVALTASACSDGDGNDDSASGDTTSATGDLSAGSIPQGDDVDITEVDVLAPPAEHEPLIAAAAQIAEDWFTAAWAPRTHEEGDDWIAQLGHPDPDIAEELHTGPTRRSDDPDEAQARDYWADIRAVLWNGADAPEERQWVDDLPGSTVSFANAAGRTTVPALIARRTDDDTLAWVRLPVVIEAGSTGTAPDGSPIHVRYLVQGDLELRPLGTDNETDLAISWLDAAVDEERLNGLRITYPDDPPTAPETVTEG